MEEDILNYLYQLSCFVGHPVFSSFVLFTNIQIFSSRLNKCLERSTYLLLVNNVADLLFYFGFSKYFL